MNRKQTQVGWGFWLQWVVATSVGWAVGGVVLSVFIGALVLQRDFPNFPGFARDDRLILA